MFYWKQIKMKYHAPLFKNQVERCHFPYPSTAVGTNHKDPYPLRTHSSVSRYSKLLIVMLFHFNIHSSASPESPSAAITFLPISFYDYTIFKTFFLLPCLLLPALHPFIRIGVIRKKIKHQRKNEHKKDR